MSTFIVLDRAKFLAALTAAGFSKDDEACSKGHELVLSRQHHLDSTMWVLVYTSLPLDGGDGRGNGTDAIRCSLIFRNPRTGRSGGMFKGTRVHRTGSTEAVIEHTLFRAREAYANGVTRATGRLPQVKKA